MSALTQTD